MVKIKHKKFIKLLGSFATEINIFQENLSCTKKENKFKYSYFERESKFLFNKDKRIKSSTILELHHLVFFFLFVAVKRKEKYL